MSRKRKVRKKKGRVRPLRLLLVLLVLTGLLAGALYVLYQTLDVKTVIELDAGHDQTQPGYTAENITENELAMRMVQGIQEQFAENSDYTILLTHDSETDMAMTKRIEKLEKDSPDITVSIHLYDEPYKSRTGTLIVIPGKGRTAKTAQGIAEDICTSLQENGRACEVVRMIYEKSREDRYTVRYLSLEEEYPSDAETRDILGISAPAIEIQLFNIEDTEDVYRWQDDEYVSLMSRIIAEGLMKFEK